MDVRSRRVMMRETSPDRAKVCPRPKVKPIKKVQIIYYLSRNGHLEHPHYIEVTHLADKPLRLRDVMERLTILRGKGMPSLYSWSCKRSYKNGYVWNDLAENDTIYPSEGAEYVLKGSELLEGCSSARLQEINQLSVDVDKQQTRVHKANKVVKYEEAREYDEEDEFEYEVLDEEKTSYSTTSTTPRSRCSRGVSTDELHPQYQAVKTTPKLRNDNDDDDDDEEDPPGGVVSQAAVGGSGRSSVLLQLIACGSSAAKRAIPAARGVSAVRNIQRGVLCKSTDEEMIKYISENPRFGNLQAEEKEYFSGSIVESMRSTEERAVAAVPSLLKKSNSYNEERSAKTGLDETVVVVVEEEKREKTKTTGKCIPRKRSSTSSKK